MRVECGCPPANAELVVFESSAHMIFAKEQDRFAATTRQVLDRSRADLSGMRFRPLRAKKNALLPGNPCRPVAGVLEVDT
jgi:hypothetical protein